MSLHKPCVFRGVATALITPFREGEIDYAALEGIIESQIAAGVDALLVAGTTGESATLTEEARNVFRSRDCARTADIQDPPRSA